ncbi:MAG TPA: diacylglycerol kinase family protein [Myxococcales bacterium]|jgi:diacylglycerol kinase family enzyme
MAQRTTQKRKAVSRPQALLVGNPAAQSGRNDERIVLARELLDKAGIAHEFLATQPEGRTSAVLERTLEGGRFSLVIAMGGDGTVSDVARGLFASGLAKQVPLGILPTGTANDIGRSFGLDSAESALERNVDVVRAGHETGFDISRLTALDEQGGKIREEIFVDSAGWGLGPKALRMRNEDRKVVEDIPFVRLLFRDHVVYAAAALKAFAESYLFETKFDVDVVADGKKLRWEGLTDLVVKSPRIYAGLWCFDPDSRHDDGLVEVMPFAGRRDWLSKTLLYLDHSGSLSRDLEEVGLAHARMIKASKLELTFQMRTRGEPIAAQVDGEEFPEMARVRIECLERALRLIVPEAQEQ